MRQGGRELPLECVEALLSLLSIPLRSLGLGVLSLAEYVDLLAFLPWESQKQVRSFDLPKRRFQPDDNFFMCFAGF